MDKDFKNLVLGCQNCKILFVIESEDFNFYEKIKVPPPTFCHDCKTVFETLIDKAKEKESNITNLKEWKQNAKQA